jgi:hypothetical protein
MEPLFYLPYTRKGLEMLLNAMDVAYMNAPTHTDDEAFAAASIQRVLKLLNNPDRLPDGTGK